MRGGLTVAETLLALAIGSIILVALWRLFGAAQVTAIDAERRLSAVAAIQLLGQTLERDLSELVPAWKPLKTEDVLAIDRRGRRLRLLVSALDLRKPLGEGRLVFLPRTIELDERTHRVMRNDAAGALTPMGGVTLAELTFRPPVRQEPGAPRGPTLPAADCLLVNAVWAPPEDLAAGRASVEKDVVRFELAFGLPHLSDEARYPGWLVNPTSRAVMSE